MLAGGREEGKDYKNTLLSGSIVTLMLYIHKSGIAVVKTSKNKNPSVLCSVKRAVSAECFSLPHSILFWHSFAIHLGCVLTNAGIFYDNYLEI